MCVKYSTSLVKKRTVNYVEICSLQPHLIAQETVQNVIKIC